MDEWSERSPLVLRIPGSRQLVRTGFGKTTLFTQQGIGTQLSLVLQRRKVKTVWKRSGTLSALQFPVHTDSPNGTFPRRPLTKGQPLPVLYTYGRF